MRAFGHARRPARIRYKAWLLPESVTRTCSPKPNPKHVESLLKFFENGRSQRGAGGFGVEIEHLPVHNSDDTAVTYYEPNGMEALLKRLAPYYDEDKEYWENGHLVGLARPGVAVSIEPGGQVETSIGHSEERPT